MIPLLGGSASFGTVTPAAVVALAVGLAGTAHVPLPVTYGEHAPNGIAAGADPGIAAIFLAMQIRVLPGAAPFLAGAPQPVVAIGIEYTLFGTMPVLLVAGCITGRSTRQAHTVLAGLFPVAPHAVGTIVPVLLV
jgi:hypothetical protein